MEVRKIKTFATVPALRGAHPCSGDSFSLALLSGISHVFPVSFFNCLQMNFILFFCRPTMSFHENSLLFRFPHSELLSSVFDAL